MTDHPDSRTALPVNCKMDSPNRYASDLDCDVCGLGEGEACEAFFARSTPLAAPEGPTGFKLVPIEPTFDILDAGMGVEITAFREENGQKHVTFEGAHISGQSIYAVWTEMLEAAPPPPLRGEVSEAMVEAGAVALWAKYKVGEHVTLAEATERWPGPDMLPACVRNDARTALEAAFALSGDTGAGTAEPVAAEVAVRTMRGEWPDRQPTPEPEKGDVLASLIGDLDAAMAGRPNVEDQWWQDCGTIKAKLLALSSRPVEPVKDDRDTRQAKVAEWCAAAFGVDHQSSVPQRGLRFLEEAIEAFQALDGDPAQAHKLIDYIYAKEPGELSQELGGVGITLLALAAAANLSADAAERKELERVLSKPLEHFWARNKVKNEAGFDALAYPSALSPDTKGPKE